MFVYDEFVDFGLSEPDTLLNLLSIQSGCNLCGEVVNNLGLQCIELKGNGYNSIALYPIRGYFTYAYVDEDTYKLNSEILRNDIKRSLSSNPIIKFDLNGFNISLESHDYGRV